MHRNYPFLTFACIASRKSTLVFCVNLAHVRELTQAFREAGVDARYLHSKTPAAERKALITAFKAAEFPVLVNCGPCLLPPSVCFLTLCSNLNGRRGHTKYRLCSSGPTHPFTEHSGSNGTS
jgi:hypothetical protein